MGKQHRGGTFEIRFRPKNGKNGGYGSAKSFLATLHKGTLQEAQKHCHGGTVVGVQKHNGK
jgi:hypothetical protein